ncbi:uncharacterized protein LOC143283158 isoform X2 [Babylonia areolata]|uniref:uncharacterized protein LOC143283158 isoform X2 n=1 Tax=Babylonia areolata TaxID=304850 RepID=UPI003FD3EDEB
MSYSAIERGQPNTLQYRIFFRGPSGNIISPFHDIPLYSDEKAKICHMVVEIPRWTNAKMEISKDEKLNPIKQDVKKGKLRYVKNIFPHHGYIWNYGALPQTWEDPKHVDKNTSTAGDNDPIDVCEIGHKIHKRGAVIQVKILGSMLLIDEGETDWKIIAIDVTDPLAEKLNDIDDVKKEMPGLLEATYEWFRYYKVPDGKPENKVYEDGKCQDRDFALDVISTTHNQWQELMENPSSSKDVCCTNSSVGRCKDKVSPEATMSLLEQSQPPEDPAPVDSEVDKWYYGVIPL